ncbi:Transposon Ty3-I Gag-Pol polyprotein [Smittium mucronatum]|uniref:Transposon Ty3-I Gag-Pol polyprotein n=1 Tax=Smittium mucronatum TaxID=133383 RepID=A0A1R0GNH4_9FUNG|nr:Transposon Ty3-I Gag-Pol polyprotein [Smittium mucronatum]OLY82784.1 Transposon Ty3-I Gag-Pol polyprotein [Smittium mucronatum]
MPCKSEWNAPIDTVLKDCGKFRISYDFRILISITIKVTYPLQLIPDIFDSLAIASIFSTLEAINGFHQVSLKREDQKKVSFSVPELGAYCYTVKPIGLTKVRKYFKGSWKPFYTAYYGRK